MLLSELLNYCVYGIVAFFAVVGLISGLRHGIGGQTVKLTLAIGSFLLSFILMGKALPFMMSHMEGKTVLEFLLGIGINIPDSLATTLASINADAAAYIMAVPLSLVVLPILFISVFFTVRGLLWFPARALRGALGFEPEANNFITRLLGGVVGLAQSVLVCAVILAPMSGMLSVASGVIENSKQKHPDSANTVAISYIFDNNFAALQSNIVLNTADQYFGFIYDSVGTVTLDGEEIVMADAVDKLFELFVLGGDLGVFDYKHLTEENKAVMSEAVDLIGEDPYLRLVVSDVTHSFFTCIDNGQVLLNFGEPIDSFLHSVVRVYEDTTKETVAADLLTTKNVYFIFNDSGTFDSMNSEEGGATVFTAFLVTNAEGKSTVSLVCDELHKNDRFDGVADQLSHLAMDVLLANVSKDGNTDTAEKILSVKEGLNEIVSIKKDEYETEEEYKSAVSETLGSTLEKNDISLPPEKLDELTDIVIENFGDLEEIDDLKMAEFMGNYYDVYASWLAGGGNPDDLPEGVNPDDLPEGVNPDDLPEGINPDDLPEGINPDDLPEGINPDDLPEGINPDDLPEGINPDDLPEGINPDDLP